LLKAGFIISLITLVITVIMAILPPTGPYHRLAMILMAVVAALTCLSFFFQIRQYRK
jgi:hypothetical protein